MIVKLASGLKPEQLKGVEAIAKVMASIGSLAGALASPLGDIAAIHEESNWLFGPSLKEIINMGS